MSYSQPLSENTRKKLGLPSNAELENRPEPVIKKQYIGNMFDDISNDTTKPDFKTRLKWRRMAIKHFYYDLKQAIANYKYYWKIIADIRCWDGHHGMLTLMIHHLEYYIDTEIKYGNSEEQYKARKVAAAKATVKILKRMRNYDGYSNYRRKQVDDKYPKYKSLVSEYKDGGRCFSGDFIAYKNGYVGKESGSNPREGYFEFDPITGLLELAESPNTVETDALLEQIYEYNIEVNNAYEQAKADSDRDFERLHRLLKTYMYAWWD